MPKEETDERKFIMIVGRGTLPKMVEAAIRFIFQNKNPHLQCVEPDKYPKIRETIKPDLVIVTDFNIAETIVDPNLPEWFVIIHKDDQQKQAESLNGVSIIEESVVFERLSATLEELLYKS